MNIKQPITLGLLGLFTASSLVTPLATNATVDNSSNEDVTLELVLAVDVSVSIDYQEFELQRQGYINAFQDAEVQNEIKKLPDGLAVSMMFWSDSDTTDIGWFKLHQDSSGNITNLQSFIDAMDGVVRRGNTDEHGNNYPKNLSKQVVIDGVTTHVGGGTDIKLGIDTARDMLLNNKYQGRVLVMDISGDGVSDDTPYTGTGNIKGECGHQHFCPPLAAARDAAINAGITINGLPINNKTSKNLANEVDIHYEKLVYGGNKSFVELSDGFDDFARAAKTKILREITQTTEATNDVFVTDEETIFTDNVLLNDLDPGNLGLAVALVNGEEVNVGNSITLPSGALVKIDLDGSLVYNPNGQFDSLYAGQSIVDTFEYSINSGDGGYSSANVAMTVEGVGILYAD